MLRRIIAITVIVIGVAALVGAVGSATFWRPDDRVTATLPSAPAEPVVITAPGVLDMVDQTVDVRVVAAADDDPVLLAMGREADVHAWIGTAPYAEITGLSTWETLAVRNVPATPPEPEDDGDAEDGTDGDGDAEDGADGDGDAEDGTDEGGGAEDGTDGGGGAEDGTDGEPGADDEATGDAQDAASELPDPAGSDLWIEEVTDTGELTYQWTAVPGRWVMLVATDGSQPAPQVELTWTRQVDTPLLIPGVIVGGVLVLAGTVALVLILLVDREAARARRARADRENAEVVLPARREGRHREEAEAELSYAQRLGWPTAEPAGTEAEPDSDVTTDTGELPTDVIGADGAPLTRRELRERERAQAEAERARTRRWWQFGRTPSQGDAQKAPDDAENLGEDRSGGQDSPGAQTGRSGTVADWIHATGKGPSEAPDGTADDHDPHTSGARWRMTWGIGQSPPDEEHQSHRTDEENR